MKKNIEDLDYYFLFMDDIPEEDRDATYGILKEAIEKYWTDQEKWELAKEMGTPKAIKDLKRSMENLKDDQFKTVSLALKYYQMKKDKTENDLAMINSLIKELHIIHNKPADVKEVAPRPSKEPIKRLIKAIFNHYNITGSDDLLKLILPLI